MIQQFLSFLPILSTICTNGQNWSNQPKYDFAFNVDFSNVLLEGADFNRHFNGSFNVTCQPTQNQKLLNCKFAILNLQDMLHSKKHDKNYNIRNTVIKAPRKLKDMIVQIPISADENIRYFIPKKATKAFRIMSESLVLSLHLQSDAKKGYRTKAFNCPTEWCTKNSNIIVAYDGNGKDKDNRGFKLKFDSAFFDKPENINYAMHQHFVNCYAKDEEQSQKTPDFNEWYMDSRSIWIASTGFTSRRDFISVPKNISTFLKLIDVVEGSDQVFTCDDCEAYDMPHIIDKEVEKCAAKH